jgi:hypothetical protein
MSARRNARLGWVRPWDGVRLGMATAGKVEWGKQRRVTDVASRWRVDAAATGGGRITGGGRDRYDGRRGESNRNGRGVGNILDDVQTELGAESVEDSKRPQDI